MKKSSLADAAMLAMKPSPMADEPSVGDGAGGEGFDQVAGQVFEALKSDDEAGFKDALKAAMQACMAGDGDTGGSY